MDRILHDIRKAADMILMENIEKLEQNIVLELKKMGIEIAE